MIRWQQSRDILSLTLGYLKPEDLISSRAVSREWRYVADNNPVWEIHCSQLWRHKLNHSHERWAVIINNDKDDDIDNTSTNNNNGNNNDRGEYNNFIRQQIEMLSLLLLSHSDSPSNIGEDQLTLLKYINIISRPRLAAPLSRLIREQQISLEDMLRECTDATYALELEAQIIQNMRTPVPPLIMNDIPPLYHVLTWRESYYSSLYDSTRVTPTYGEIRLQGAWLALYYGINLSFLRFVSGGKQIVTGITFYDEPGDVKLSPGCIMMSTDIYDFHFMFSRDPHDWNWIGTGDPESKLVFFTYDREIGPHLYESRLVYKVEADSTQRWEIEPLTSPQLESPLNQLYAM